MGKIDYNTAYKSYEKVAKVLNEMNLKYELTGSMRRKKTKVGDIDIIIESDNELYIRECIKKELSIDKIDDNGKFVLENGIIIQIIVVKKEDYSYNLWTSTGSKKHIKSIIEIYKDKKIKIPNNESDIYSKIDIDYILPEERDKIWRKI